MSYRNDKVSDALAVLAAMRNDFNRTKGSRNSTKFRIDAVKGFAESELRAKNRFKDQLSAVNSINDACTRRLMPDVASMSAFDEFADQWLWNQSTTLRDILTKHSKNSSQRSVVSDFFAGKNNSNA
jgi:hypothetical protein